MYLTKSKDTHLLHTIIQQAATIQQTPVKLLLEFTIKIITVTAFISDLLLWFVLQKFFIFLVIFWGGLQLCFNIKDIWQIFVVSVSYINHSSQEYPKFLCFFICERIHCSFLYYCGVTTKIKHFCLLDDTFSYSNSTHNSFFNKCKRINCRKRNSFSCKTCHLPQVLNTVIVKNMNN